MVLASFKLIILLNISYYQLSSGNIRQVLHFVNSDREMLHLGGETSLVTMMHLDDGEDDDNDDDDHGDDDREMLHLGGKTCLVTKQEAPG